MLMNLKQHFYLTKVYEIYCVDNDESHIYLFEIYLGKLYKKWREYFSSLAFNFRFFCTVISYTKFLNPNYERFVLAFCILSLICRIWEPRLYLPLVAWNVPAIISVRHST